METQSSSRRTALSVFLIIIFCTAVMGFVCAQKNQYHVDEIWTYALSNSYEKPFFFTIAPGTNGYVLPDNEQEFNIKENEDYQSYFYHWNNGTFYHNYITVQPEQRFTYANVYRNQEMDTHPPLYYFIIHTICSFFPDRFSKWFGMVPNLVFYALSLLILFFISKELCNSSQKAMLTILFWGLSRAGISTVIYIRMYMLLTLLVLCLTWLHLLLLKNFRRKYVILIVIVDILGFLTQYYYYIYAFFITAFTCLILLRRKEIKQILGFGFSVLGAVGISIAAFPAAIRHLTHGVWSDATAKNAVTDRDSFSSMMLLVSSGYADIFIFIITTVTALLYLIDVLKTVYRKESPVSASAQKEKFTDILRPVYDYMCKGNFLIIASAFCTGMFVCQIAPDMESFRNRYIFFILPFFAVIFTDMLILSISKAAGIFPKALSPGITYLTAGIIILACITYGNLNGNNIYIRNGAATENDPDLNTIITDRQVILVNVWIEHHIHAYSYAFSNASIVCPVDDLNDSLAEIINQYENTEPLLLIVEGYIWNPFLIENFLSNKTSCEFQYVASTHYILNSDYDLYVYELTPHQ